MSTVQPQDLSIYPAYLCVGRPPLEQVVIAHVWRKSFCEGKAMSKAAMSTDCGTTPATLKKAMDKLIEEGVLKRGGKDIDLSFIPERPVVIPKQPKKKSPYPEYVFWAMRTGTQATGGVYTPVYMKMALDGCVKEYGAEKVAFAIRGFTTKTDINPRYDTPRAFAKVIGDYLPTESPERRPTSRSFKDRMKA